MRAAMGMPKRMDEPIDISALPNLPPAVFPAAGAGQFNLGQPGSWNVDLHSFAGKETPGESRHGPFRPIREFRP